MLPIALAYISIKNQNLPLPGPLAMFKMVPEAVDFDFLLICMPMLLEACRANENYTVSDNKRGKRYERGSFSEGSGNNNRVRVDTRVGGGAN
jgi:hypothetical protein